MSIRNYIECYLKEYAQTAIRKANKTITFKTAINRVIHANDTEP